MDKEVISIKDYCSRSLIIFPDRHTNSVNALVDDKNSCIQVIERSTCQAYFVKNLHARHHGELGPNGRNFLLSFLCEKQVPVMITKNTKNTDNVKEQMFVLNEGNTKERIKMLNKINHYFHDILATCKSSIRKAFTNCVDKRGTIALNFGFTMQKCTDFTPTNALLDFNIPTHCSGVENPSEIKNMLNGINELLLKLEAMYTHNGKVFGVPDGRWFDDEQRSILSQYKYQFANKMGIDTTYIDWRLYGCTIIFTADALNLHIDKYNAIHENYNMVVVFSTVIHLNALPESVYFELKEIHNFKSKQFLNCTVVTYGRQQIESFLKKYENRKSICIENPSVRDFIHGVTKDATWGYECWLHNGAKEYINDNIPVLNAEKLKTIVQGFNSRLNQSKENQMKENQLFLHTFCSIPALMSKQLYWSSFTTVYYRMQIVFNLEEYDMFEVFLFLATETNGQCLISQMFFWHILCMEENQLKQYIEACGSIYIFLCNVLVRTVNR